MNLNLKGAAIRALRTFFQSLAGALVAFPVAEAVSDLKAVGGPLILALWTALLAGVLSFLQNVIEDSTPINIPKD